jgi:hypothetical protein
MMNFFTEKTLGSPLTWAPHSISGPSLIAKDLQASRQLWNGLLAG